MLLLEKITLYLAIYGFIIILILGTVGSLFNLITFLSRPFRTQACTFYMICSSFLELIFINYGSITRLITEYSGSNLINTDVSICKSRSYLSVCLPAMASACVMLATFDRCVSTSSHIRWQRLSSLSFAGKLFIVLMLILLAAQSFLVIVFDLRDGSCTTLPGLQSIMVTIFTNIFVNFIPHIGMLVFGFLTWLHIKQSRNRILATSHSTPQMRNCRNLNRHLMLLTFLRAVLSIIIVSLRSITYSYAVITGSIKKDTERQAIEYFFQQVSILLFYINYSMSFYVNYYSSTLFKKKFRASVQRLVYKCLFFCNRH